MENKTNTHRASFPTDPVKRVDSVMAVCVALGHVNRDVLAQYYGFTQLEASILLREFLQTHVKDVRRDTKNDCYVLLGYS